MPSGRHFPPVDMLELKLQIETRLGSVKACKYFDIVTRFLSLKISKHEFDRRCIATVGRDNVHLHNHFIRSILKKACLSKIPSPRKGKAKGSLSVQAPNGYRKSNLQLLCKDFPQSPRRGRTPNLRDRRFRDRPSPLGPNGKNHNIACEDSVPNVHEQQSATDLHSLISRPPLSVEEGEEVDQDFGSPSIYNRSPIRAPLGIAIEYKRSKNCSGKGSVPGTVTNTCQSIGQLPDTCSLMKRLEQKCEMEGLKISADSANLLNNALDVYLKRLIKPCLELVVSKSVDKFSGPIQPGSKELLMGRGRLATTFGEGLVYTESDIDIALVSIVDIHVSRLTILVWDVITD
ncbi:Transcriptional coactivator Hfi1/Transcriptional adapter 1 [Sesbania bispinosa]|nr:Transcriptional coactivator Hfi1/Transcriptional adapter 1 [Sesbania bispinosa]